MSATELHWGTNFGATRRHVLTEKFDPSSTHGSWRDAYRTLCGSNVVAYDPADSSVPHSIRTIDISAVTACLKCTKKAGL